MADEDEVSDLNVCRSCLNINVRMHSIMNTRFREMYERVTNQQLELDRGCPDTMCYVCMCEVRRFHKFIEMSKKAEKTLRNLLLNRTEVYVMDKMRKAHEFMLTKKSLAYGKVSCRNMKNATIQLISILDELWDEEPDVVVSVEACDTKALSVEETVEWGDGEDYALHNDDTMTDSEASTIGPYNDILNDNGEEKKHNGPNIMSVFDKTSTDKFMDIKSFDTADTTSKDKVEDKTSALDDSIDFNKAIAYTVDKTSEEKVVDKTSKDKVVDRTSIYTEADRNKTSEDNELLFYTYRDESNDTSVYDLEDKESVYSVDSFDDYSAIIEEEPEVVVSVEACDTKGLSVEEMGEWEDCEDYAIHNDDTITDSVASTIGRNYDIKGNGEERKDDRPNKMLDFDKASKGNDIDKMSVDTADKISAAKVVDKTSVIDIASVINIAYKNKDLNKATAYTVDITSEDKVVDKTSKAKVVDKTSVIDIASVINIAYKNKDLNKATAYTVDKTSEDKVVDKTSKDKVVDRTSIYTEADDNEAFENNETLFYKYRDENNETSVYGPEDKGSVYSVHSSDDDSVSIESGTNGEVDEAELVRQRLLCSEVISDDDSDEDKRAKIQACIERLDEMDEEGRETTSVSKELLKTDEVLRDSNNTDELDDIQKYILVKQKFSQLPVTEEMDYEVREADLEFEEIADHDFIEVIVGTTGLQKMDENEIIEVTRNTLGSKKMDKKQINKLIVYTDEYKNKMHDTLIILPVNESENLGTVDLPVAKKSKIHEDKFDSLHTRLSVKPSQRRGTVDLPVAKKSKINENVFESLHTRLSVKPSQRRGTVDLPVAKKSKINENVFDSLHTQLSVKPSERKGIVDLPVAKKSKFTEDIFDSVYTQLSVKPSENQGPVDLPVAKKSKINENVFDSLHTQLSVKPSERKGIVDLPVAKKSKFTEDILDSVYTQLSVKPSENQGPVDLPVAKKSKFTEDIFDSLNTQLSVKPSKRKATVDLPVAKKSKFSEDKFDSLYTTLSLKPSVRKGTVDLPVAKKSKFTEDIFDSLYTQLSVKPSERKGTVDLPVAKKSKFNEDIVDSLYTQLSVKPSENQGPVDSPVAKKSKILIHNNIQDIFNSLYTELSVKPIENKDRMDTQVAKKPKVYNDIFDTQPKLQDNNVNIIATKRIEFETDTILNKDQDETVSVEDNMVKDINKESQKIIQLLQTVCVNLEKLTPEIIEKYTKRKETHMSNINKLSTHTDNIYATENDLLVDTDVKKKKSRTKKSKIQSANKYMTSNDLLVARDIKELKSEINKRKLQSANEYMTSNDLLVARDIEGFQETILHEKCQLCDFSTDDRYDFRTHKKMHKEKYEYLCPNCSHGFHGLRDLNDHKIHNCYRCEICDRPFSFKCYLKKHIRTHNEANKYKCSYCQKRFTYKSSLANHTQNKHLIKEKTTFTCTICYKPYHYQGNLNIHMMKHKFKLRTITKHEFESFLDKKMALVHSMKTNMDTLELYPYKCDLCNIQQDYRSILQ